MPKTAVGPKQKIVAEFRRSEILAAAAKVFANKGFQAARMEEIAKAAQLAKGTLYLYFHSKDEIYETTVQQALSKLAALTEEHVEKEPEFAGKLAAFISVRIAFWHEQQQLYRIILSISPEGQHRKRRFAWRRAATLYLQSMFADAARAGEIPHQDFLAAAWITTDAIRGVNERRLLSEGSSTDDDVKFLTEFLLSALRAGRGPGPPTNSGQHDR
jgi:AcrR family transcriptional regulator